MGTIELRWETYAVGDVIGWPALVSTAMEQGRIAVCHAFNRTYKKLLAPILPTGIYTVPEISWVGLTEEAAREAGIDYEVGRAPYLQNARGLIIGDTPGIVKLIFAASTPKAPGGHRHPGTEARPRRASHAGGATAHRRPCRRGDGHRDHPHRPGLPCSHTERLIISSNLCSIFPRCRRPSEYAAYDGLARLEQRQGETVEEVEGQCSRS